MQLIVLPNVRVDTVRGVDRAWYLEPLDGLKCQGGSLGKLRKSGALDVYLAGKLGARKEEIGIPLHEVAVKIQ